MARTFGLIVVLAALAACGVDAPPVPPGQDNPRDVQQPSDVNVSGFF